MGRPVARFRDDLDADEARRLDRYFFAFDGDVAPDGTVYFAQSAILYGGGGNKGTLPSEPIEEHVFVSRDRGQTWDDRTVASVQPGVACPSGGCTPDYFLGHNAIAADAAGGRPAVRRRGEAAGGLQTIEARRSTDRGRTWSAPTTLSVSGEEALAPAVESTGNGDVRAWYQQTAGRWQSRPVEHLVPAIHRRRRVVGLRR